jgi:flagellar basal-body rod protein FlgG
MGFAGIWAEDSMVKGIYTAASGMIPHVKKQEVISNNLANVNTSGYKRQDVFTEELKQSSLRRVPRQEKWEIPMISDVYTDHSQAVIEHTGREFDLALDGSGFFVVQSPDGEDLYTRAGDFNISTDGTLVSPEGYSLVTDSGLLAVDANSNLQIGIDGTITANGQTVGKLALVDFEKPYRLERLSGSIFRAPSGAQPVEPEHLFVRQGYLEKANVDVVKEMIEMITSFREYESNQKAVQIVDGTLEKTVNQVGAKR